MKKKKLFTSDQRSKRSAPKQLTFDGFDNFLSKIGLNNENALSGSKYTFDLLTRNRIELEAAYRGSWVAGQIIDSFADDMTRAGIDITTNEADEDIKDLQNNMSRLQIWQSINQGTKWGRLYGGATGFIQIEGQDPATPLRIDTVGKDQFLGVVPLDRWQLNPVVRTVIKNGPDMGLPEFYQIVSTPVMSQPENANQAGQQTVHHTRMIRFIGIQLPFFQAITEMMWGESILERLWDRMIAFDNATMSSASLIDRANLRTVQIDGLREIVAAGGQALKGLEKQFEMMKILQVSMGLTLLDKNDIFSSTSYTFAGLSDMLLQFGQQLAGASGIPLVRLFGQSPAGLSATGESDMRQYYDNVNAQQEARLRRPMDVLLKVLWRSTFGKPAPKDLEFSFTPLWQMSNLDKATVAKTNAETVLGAYEAGATDRATAMKELRQSSGDTGVFSNITDEDIAEAESDEPPMPETDPAPAPEAKPDEPKEPVKNLDQSFASKLKRFLGKK